MSFIILIFIYVNAYNRLEKVFVQYKLFIALIQTNMVMIIIDILGWIFNGLPGSLNMISNQGFNLLLYIMEPIGPMLWVLYTNFQVFHDENRIRKLKKILISLFTINALTSATSLYTGWFFSIDAINIYHRGNFFWVHAAFCHAFIIYSFFFILIKRSMLERRYYYSLLLFFLPQTVGTSIQTLSYGVSYNWSGMMLSILIVYFNIQDKGLSTDYLTGAYNRRQLDRYIKVKILNSTAKKTFSAILIDLDDFKQINDKFGHDVGDQALQDTVKIIKKCLSNSEFVARFGGDEFFIILENDNRQLLEQTVKRVLESVEKFNNDSHTSYKISLSMGYDVYDYELKMNPDDFFKHIDALMYNNKKSLIN